MPKAYLFSTNVLRDFTTLGASVTRCVPRLVPSHCPPSMLDVKTNGGKPRKLSLWLTDSETPHLILAPLPGSGNLSILLLSVLSFISFPGAFPGPPLLTAYSVPFSPEWGDSRSEECLASPRNGNRVPRVPTASP